MEASIMGSVCPVLIVSLGYESAVVYHMVLDSITVHILFDTLVFLRVGLTCTETGQQSYTLRRCGAFIKHP